MKLLQALVCLVSTGIAWAQFGSPPNPIGGGPGVLTHVGACGDQQQCYTFCPAGSVLAAPTNADGAVDCITLSTTHLPPQAVFSFDTPEENRIVTFVSPDSKEAYGCPVQCASTGSLVSPASTTVPGRIWLFEVKGAGDNFVRIQVPPSGLSTDRVIETYTDGHLRLQDSKLEPAPPVNRVACIGIDGKIFAGDGTAADGQAACPASVSTTSTTSSTSSSSAAPTTSTSTSTSTSVSTSTSTSSTIGGGCSNTITQTAEIDKRMNILSTHIISNGAACNHRQRVSNSSSIIICSLTLCVGHGGSVGTGKLYPQIWSDKTVGCTGAPNCPDAKLGGDPNGDSDGTSDGKFDVSTLAAGENLAVETGGACGSGAGDGKLVTFTWSASKPNPTGNFWIVMYSAEAPDTISATHYIGSSESATAHSTTDFDMVFSCSSDSDDDVYFEIGTE